MQFREFPLEMLKGKTDVNSEVHLFSIFCFSKHDIIVARLPGNDIPGRSPQSYSNDEIRNGVNNLYVAVRRPGAPKSDDIVTIGNSVHNQRKRRNLAGKYLYHSNI